MRRVIPVLLAALALAAAPKDDAGKKDLEKMQGDWACEAMERDGFKFPDEAAQSYFRTVKDNSYTVSRYRKAAGKGTFKLDTTKTPRAMDITPAAGGKPILAIYKIEGDTFTMCYAMPGGERPKEFATKADSGHTLAVWKREKK
jgi:uncharacterized protein (TIGR03067 family)